MITERVWSVGSVLHEEDSGVTEGRWTQEDDKLTSRSTHQENQNTQLRP